jgi:hypothetical protein
MLIYPIAKNPDPCGRMGPRDRQDWYRACQEAVAFADAAAGSQQANGIRILTLSARTDPVNELEWYRKALHEIGLPLQQLTEIAECTETTCQVRLTLGIADKSDEPLYVFATWLHWPRVAWLYWWYNAHGVTVRVYPAFGLPRWPDALTDIILTALVPLINISDRFLHTELEARLIRYTLRSRSAKRS